MVAGGERDGTQSVALFYGADANLPLALTQRRYSGRLPRAAAAAAAGAALRCRTRGRDQGVTVATCRCRRRIRPGTRLGSADLPRIAELVDALGHLTRLHAQVVATPAVEVAAQAAQPILERRRHRHLQEALAVPQQLHSCIIIN